jgi:hypothetical protein
MPLNGPVAIDFILSELVDPGTDMLNFTISHKHRVVSPVPVTVKSCCANFGQVRARAQNGSIVDEAVSARKC